MAKKKEETGLFNLPVGYGSVNIGDKMCSIKATISRSNLKLSEADKSLCNRRLTGKIIAKPSGWKAEENPLPGMDHDLEMTGTFDVKGLRVTSDDIGIGLTFNIKDVDVSTLAQFAKRMGRLLIEEVSNIPEGTDDEFGNGDAA